MRIAVAAAALALAGCGGGGEELQVYAASSLREVLPRIDGGATYNFAGSDALATQIREGADADVFVSAGERPARALADEGLLEGKRYARFATNRLVVVTPRDNPARVITLRDLAHPSVDVVLADAGVPAGDYAREALTAAGAEGALDNVVSFEDDVRGVLAKVALGEADAGIVYATDAEAAFGDVLVVEIAPRFQPRIEYVVGIVDGADEAAQEFVDRLVGAEGRRALRAAGFGVP